MALNASTRKPKKSDEQESDTAARIQKHLESLGLNSAADYAVWCTQHGFTRNINKSHLQRELEYRVHQQSVADSRLAQKKRENRSLKSTLQVIFRGEVREHQVTSPALKMICQAYTTLHQQPAVCRAFLELLTQVSDHTDLIQLQHVIPHYGRDQDNSYLGGLLALAHHSHSWIRKPSDWKPGSHNAGRQFQSFARHLFAKWPVPGFMDSVWFQGTSSAAQQKQSWFVHLARGENIRTAELAIPYSKRMAHHFMRAPNDHTVEDALRWGQIHALGGNARLVKAVLGTRLRTKFEHDEFWLTVFQFLIANPMLDLAQVGPIVDYLQHVKFTPQEIFIAPGQLERRPPLQPNLTMKGRTPEALLRNVTAWHRTLTQTSQPPAEWKPCGIPGLTFVEGTQEGQNLKIWKITELLSSAALIAEGKKMRHCVASYVRSCERGDCSIWTLELETSLGHSKILTLEVRNSSKMLVQARGKFNIVASQKERSILHRWAEQAGLQVVDWI